MCDDLVQRYPSSLQFVPDWFVTSTNLDLWNKYNGTQHTFDQDYNTREAQCHHKHLDPYPSCNNEHEIVVHPPLF